jgi:N-acetylglucosaminyl-diphospho-decaprenol L-rhamnosyltransferase
VHIGWPQARSDRPSYRASCDGVHDLAIVLVAHHGDRWLAPCLTSVFEHAGDCELDVVVANNADDGAAEILAAEFPSVRLVRCENRGFAHANNQALATCDARYVLFLNLDTEIVSGTFAELVAALDSRPAVGMAGVKQLSPEGVLAPTIRWFPNAVRALGDALGLERLPIRGSWAGERELDLARYDEEQPCDWTSGSFLVVRRDVLERVGGMDERFFLYSEEPDLCLRGRQAGWEMRHLPSMTIVHHAGKAGVDPRLVAQDAYSRRQFAEKHFSRPHRFAYELALGLGLALRALVPGRGRATQRRAARAGLRSLAGIGDPPFGPAATS